ncbi:MAG TPA: TonB-dependent receptor [Candidatus Angelobacter sp.]|nr:TonB-dependent receptor [Candidatus Angelobacter sp.]
MSASSWSALLAALIFVTPLCPVSWAQSTAANTSIVVTVSDPQRALIPGATVAVRSADQGIARSATTNDRGRAVFSGLPAGTYAVEVRAAGFASKKLSRISSAGGSSIELNVALQIAAVSQETTVTGQGPSVEGNTVQPAVNKRKSETGNYMPGLTVTYLPSRDRDLSQLAQLAAGVTVDPSAAGLSIAGQRPSASETAVDGADFNDPLLGGQRGARDGTLFFPQTVVREFQVVRSGTGAEIGGTNAGFLNVVTKEGGNKFRGEFFYIGRPPLSSEDAFGNSLSSSQNQFGGSFGGPIRHDRAFFYAGVEQDFLHIPYQTLFAPQAPGTLIPATLSSLQQKSLQKSSPTALFLRTDVLLNSANTFNLQADFNRVDSSSVGDGSSRTLAAPEHSDSLTGRSLWLHSALNTVFGQNVNQFLAQWSRDSRAISPNDLSPEIFIAGFGILGGDPLAPNQYVSQRREISDDVEISHGSTLLHFGAQFAFNPVRQQQEAGLNGRFLFNSLSDFIAGNITRFQQTFIAGDPLFQGAVRQVAFFATGNIALTKTLSLTAGLRWDGQWNPQLDVINPAIPQTATIPDDLMQWQPRLGLAWNPRPATVVRLSSGIYDAPTPATIFQRVFTDNGVNTASVDSFFDPSLLELPSVSSLQALTVLPPGLSVQQAEVVGISPDFRNPRSFQVSGTVEQEINKKLTLVAGYLRNSTWDLNKRPDRNLFPPTISSTGLPIFPATRPVGNVGRVLINESGAHSSYDALLLTATLQLSRRSQLTANYTLSRSRDNDILLSPFDPDLTLNPFAPSADQAFSSLDARHNLNVNAVVNLPLGFKVNPVLVARSGLPYTPIVGFDTNNDGNDWNDRPLVGGAIAPRNILRQPSLFNLDLRFVKDFTLKGEGHHLDLFMDVFNITGAGNTNFGPYAVSLFGPASTPFLSAGQPLFAPDAAHFGSTRQIQFTARLVAF